MDSDVVLTRITSDCAEFENHGASQKKSIAMRRQLSSLRFLLTSTYLLEIAGIPC